MRTTSHLLLLLLPSATAWSAIPSTSGRTYVVSREFHLSMAEKPVADSEGKTEIIETAETPEPQWGVSFIGGDPCGSKYNTDPHDAKVEKPGMPASMKERIRLLAEQKKREAEEKGEK